MFGLGFKFPQLAAGGGASDLSLEEQIRKLFANGEQGGMWDFTSPIDLSNYAEERGPELALPLPEWDLSGSTSIEQGEIIYTEAGSTDRASMEFPGEVGDYFEIEVECTVTAGQLVTRGAFGTAAFSAGTFRAILSRANTATFQITGHAQTPTTAIVHSVSLRKLPGIPRAAMFQDSAGTTPVTAVGQPVGLMLDRRFGLARGDELLPSYDFQEWATHGNVVAKEAHGFSSSGSASAVSLSGVFEAGKTYEVGVKIKAIGAVTRITVRNAVGGGAPIILSTEDSSLDAKAVYLTTSTVLYIRVDSPPGEAIEIEVSALSIRELPGNHLSQATTAARPTYTVDGALHDGVDDFLQAANAGDWTFLHDGTGGFMGASSIYLGEAGDTSGYYGTQAAGNTSIGISQGQQNVNLARSLARLAGDEGVLVLPASGTGSMPSGVVASEMLQHANSHVVRWLNGVEFGDTPYDGFVPSANDPSQAITTHIGFTSQPLVRRRIIAINRTLTESERASVNAWLMEGTE